MPAIKLNTVIAAIGGGIAVVAGAWIFNRFVLPIVPATLR